MFELITIKNAMVFSIVALMRLTTVSAQEWQTDLNSAMSLAAKEDKPIILVFQGSDWCAPCIRLDREVWNTESFRKYAQSHYVLLRADLPRKRANQPSQEQANKNAALAEKYNVNGIFPLVVILDKDGKLLGKTGYINAGPEAYIKELNSFIH
jgi:thioredoxin-related protein